MYIRNFPEMVPKKYTISLEHLYLKERMMGTQIKDKSQLKEIPVSCVCSNLNIKINGKTNKFQSMKENRNSGTE